jgi:hypothetical protein
VYFGYFLAVLRYTDPRPRLAGLSVGVEITAQQGCYNLYQANIVMYMGRCLQRAVPELQHKLAYMQ